MNYIGNRIYHNQYGKIIFETGEHIGNVAEKVDNEIISYIDLEYGQVDLTKYRIVGVNLETKQPILEEIIQELTVEQKQIKELEDQLLLATDNEVGGIL